jgi:hypothetical protein
MAMVVDGEQTAGLVEFDMMANRREEVEDLTVVGRCVADAVGGDDGQAE